MDKGNHENTLKEINEYLLSFFQFAAQSASTEFQESEWIAFAGIPGKWNKKIPGRHFYPKCSGFVWKVERLLSSGWGIMSVIRIIL